MSNVMYIEDRRALHKLTMALNFAAKPKQWIEKELKETLTAWQTYRRDREDIHESMNGWDCGRQDAWYDSFDEFLTRMQALRLARKIQRGNGSALMRLTKQVMGETP